MDAEKLKMTYLPPDKLKPYERNARRHAEEDLATIRASVQRFGFIDPIGVWGPQNIIVEGHGRWMVAKELGMESVPVIRLDDLSDEERKAYALAHNKTAEMSGWDFTALEEELEALEEDFDMSDFGFTKTDVAALDDLFAPVPEKEKDEEPQEIKCPHCGMWFVP